MNSAFTLPTNCHSQMKSKKTMPDVQLQLPKSFKPSTKFWGVWLPVPTFLAIINSLFWTWLILSTVGYTVDPIEKAAERIIELF